MSGSRNGRGRPSRWLAALAIAVAAGCAPPDPGPHMARVPAGTYFLGSDSAERELGYTLSPPAVRGADWYDAWERSPYRIRLDAFWIDRTPVTQAEYANFVSAESWRAPYITQEAYRRQGYLAHPYPEVLPFLWHNRRPDPSLLDHPVVLVSHRDAVAYCSWRDARLPTESEWEAACRGPESGRLLPWGDEWVDGAAQIGATGTAPVTAHPEGATPEGVLDLAGNVFEWTSSSLTGGSPVLKGCSWDDAPGTCRCAFRHGRPAESRHILIGFRCVRDR
jgi:formylglycine-generating enzyme required for sulfatase activity